MVTQVFNADDVGLVLLSEKVPGSWNQLVGKYGYLNATSVCLKIEGAFKEIGNQKRYDKLVRKYKGALEGLYLKV